MGFPMKIPPITGVVLAGGLARRMNRQDKGLVRYRGQPLVRYALNALAPMANPLIINANRNQATYAAFGYPVIADETDEFAGPLAGILATLKACPAGILVVVPCDCPLLQSVHLQKLIAALLSSDSEIAVAFDGQRLQPVVFSMKTELSNSLATYLASGQRKISDWLAQHQVTRVDFSDEATIFLNINTLEELAALAQKDSF